jgi:hypothetical protein
MFFNGVLLLINMDQMYSFKRVKMPKNDQGSTKRSSHTFIKDYSFSRRINRIYEERQIEPLFEIITDIKGNRKGGSSQYRGKISGIDVKIDFSLNKPCYMYTKNEDDLNIAYNQILDILIKRN